MAMVLAQAALTNPARATSLTLVGGAAVPYDIGFVPDPPPQPQPFTAGDIAALSDGNPATTYIFSSSQGQFSSNPGSVDGFGIRFDFDISRFSQVNTLDFTWTGLFTWTGAGDPSIRIGSDPTVPQISLNFGTTNAPSGIAQTGTVNFNGSSSDFHFDIASVLHGDVASIWVATDLGFSVPPGATVDHLTLTTYDVSANATGTLAPVPLPSSLVLLLSALGAAVFGYAALSRRGSMPALDTQLEAA
jgi:hypothetical protein